MQLASGSPPGASEGYDQKTASTAPCSVSAMLDAEYLHRGIWPHQQHVSTRYNVVDQGLRSVTISIPDGLCQKTTYAQPAQHMASTPMCGSRDSLWLKQLGQDMWTSAISPR